MSLFIVISAVWLDAVFGEPRRYHPLVGFGYFVAQTENWLYSDSRQRGLFAVSLLLLPFLGLGLLLESTSFTSIATVLLLYSAIGRNSLGTHAHAVFDALDAHDISTARQKVSYIVSRDTSTLDEQGIVSATIETVLENGNDAIFAAIFWALVAGPTGVILYRLINTLDAMWGYKNNRYNNFGWAAARLDDAANYIPARLTALTYAFASNFRYAITCWQQQAASWKSPNAGPVMATGAGALHITLGGTAVYHGKPQQRPTLGMGLKPLASDIPRSLNLIDRALIIWIAFLLLGQILNAVAR